jgi:AcrR family transcriptional regulator
VTEPVRKRGPVPRISREAVLEAARQLPASGMTMTAIAAELGVTAGALYRYFPDRSSVLEALATERQALLEPPDPDLGWREWLAEEIQRECALWASHPELADVAAMPAVVGPATMVIEVGLEVLTRDGFSRDDALHALTAASVLAFGLNKMVEARSQITEHRTRDSAAGARLRELGLVIDLDKMSKELIAITLDGLAARRASPRSGRQQARRRATGGR